MKKIDLAKIKIVRGLPPVAKKGDKISWDTEFFNQEKKRLHRPHGDFAFLGCTSDGETVYYITEVDDIKAFLDKIDAGVWILHNAKYDLTQLRRFTKIPQRKRLWDTMLIEQIMWSGYFDGFSLADVARRRLDIYLPKEQRKEFSLVKSVDGKDVVLAETYAKSPYNQSGHDSEPSSMTSEMLEYACADVIATWQVYQHQRAEIDENDLRIWKDIELPFLWTLLAMSGVRLDTKAWTKLAEKNEQTSKEISDKYPDINLNSPKQVKERLGFLGYKLKSTDAEALEKIADKSEFARNMLSYRTYFKRSSTYGAKFIEDYVEEDGRIYGDIFQMGAQTGRTSSRSPNLQNQPNDAEYRSCFIADKGNCMIVGDWGAQEPRIGAYHSQDAGLIAVLNSDKVIYIEIAREALGLNIKSKKEVEYKHTKSVILGLFYGMSAYGLAKHIGVSEEAAQDMINKILETYPGIQDYIDRQQKAGDYVQSIYGRKIWLNKYNKGWLRDALNFPMQSSAADAMKIAAHRFDEMSEGESDWRLQLLVHDEIVISVPKADCEGAKQLLSECMISVAEEMHDGIKGSVEIFSGDNWGCKV